ncbi:MAG: hypothetical protein E6J58_19025 [Deltaproteobacteria bacterium]|nr:MAG: hypothetical protein E6J58_19025 [Deltaproteobacteria bacterium]
MTQLSDGTIVVGGGDSNQQNVCSTHKQPFFGGAWLVAVTPTAGQNVFQKLYSTCANSAQSTSAVAHTADGGFVLAGGDFDNPACAGGCGWFAKFRSDGTIAWQRDLTGAYFAGASIIEPMPDGTYIAVGNESPTYAQILEGLIMKISSSGALQWSVAYSETAQSFPGAFDGGSFTLGSLQPTADGGYVATGVADAKLASGYAHVLVVMKLDASGGAQWSNAYYGNVWESGGGGESSYPIFLTPDGGYVVSGTVQQRDSPFQELFFLLKLDARGGIVWQKGYGGSNGYYDVSREQGGAVATPDGGFVLAGESNVFAQATTGWMLKTDASGNIVWQKTYTGLTSGGGNRFNGVIRTSDGGYAVAGDSWTADLTYGGPGMWLVKTDSNGNVGTCGCMKDTNASAQTLDLQVFPATFVQEASGLAFGPVNIQAKSTSVKPTTIYP